MESPERAGEEKRTATFPAGGAPVQLVNASRRASLSLPMASECRETRADIGPSSDAIGAIAIIGTGFTLSRLPVTATGMVAWFAAAAGATNVSETTSCSTKPGEPGPVVKLTLLAEAARRPSAPCWRWFFH